VHDVRRSEHREAEEGGGRGREGRERGDGEGDGGGRDEPSPFGGYQLATTWYACEKRNRRNQEAGTRMEEQKREAQGERNKEEAEGGTRREKEVEDANSCCPLGRLGRVLYVPPPEAKARKEILLHYLNKIKSDPEIFQDSNFLSEMVRAKSKEMIRRSRLDRVDRRQESSMDRRDKRKLIFFR
jgi:hypothetical protein